MAIPASKIVNIYPRVLTAGGTDLVLNGMFLTTNDLLYTSDMAKSFSSPDSVGEYFGTESDEYTAASVYFAGYDNSFKKPTTIWFGRRVLNATQALVIGAEYTSNLAALTAVTDGALTISVNGTTYSISDVDLSESTSYSDVAAVITTALVSAGASVTVSYSSVTDSFTIATDSTGSGVTIDYPAAPESGTDIASLLNLYEDDGAMAVDGCDSMTWADNVKAIKTVTDNWVSFTTIYEADADEILTLASWATDQGTNYLYQPWISDPDTAAEIHEALTDADVSATAYMVIGLEMAAFVCGIGACIDWNRVNGTITYAFKSQSGLSADTISESDMDTYEANGINIYGQFATRNDDYVFLHSGKMYGDYGYIDAFINAVWLNNKLQVSIMEGLTTTGRAPYTDAGYTLIKAWMMDPIEAALKNGVIEPGVSLSNSQEAELYREIGLDVSEEINTEGYFLSVEDPGASARVNRETPTCGLYYSYGGSVHAIELPSTAIL